MFTQYSLKTIVQSLRVNSLTAPFELKNTFAVISVGLNGPYHCRTVFKSLDAYLIDIIDLAPRGAELVKEICTAS